MYICDRRKQEIITVPTQVVNLKDTETVSARILRRKDVDRRVKTVDDVICFTRSNCNIKLQRNAVIIPIQLWLDLIRT